MLGSSDGKFEGMLTFSGRRRWPARRSWAWWLPLQHGLVSDPACNFIISLLKKLYNPSRIIISHFFNFQNSLKLKRKKRNLKLDLDKKNSALVFSILNEISKLDLEASCAKCWVIDNDLFLVFFWFLHCCRNVSTLFLQCCRKTPVVWGFFRTSLSHVKILLQFNIFLKYEMRFYLATGV